LSVEQQAIAPGLYTSRPASFKNYFVAKNTPETPRHLRTMTSSAQGAPMRDLALMRICRPPLEKGVAAPRGWGILPLQLFLC